MKRHIIAAIGITLLLVGCSGGTPDASDVQSAVSQAIKSSIKKSEQNARAMGGDSSVKMMHKMGFPSPDDIDVSNVQIQESKQLENGDYRMQVSLDVKMGDKSMSKSMSLIMHKTDGGWVAQDLPTG